MSVTHYCAIAVRLFSIGLLIFCANRVGLLLEEYVSGAGGGIPASFSLLSGLTVIPLLIAVLMWFFPLTVAKWIIKPELDKPLEAINAQSLLTVLLLAIGLYAFYNALTDSIYWGMFWHMSTQEDYYSEASVVFGEENSAAMIATAFEFAISLTILLKARMLAYRMLQLTR